MHGLDRLFVIWSDPAPATEGRRHVIGELWRDRDGFAFAYAADVSAARQAGFQAIPEFPELRRVPPYRARHLFWTFAERIPSPRRPDYRDLMRTWGVEASDDQFEVLARSGGVQATDRLELAEYRSEDDDLRSPLLFRLAGERFAPHEAELSPGDAVSFRAQPDNMFDSSAVHVVCPGDRVIGWVPVQYSKLFARLLADGRGLKAHAERRLQLPQARGRWVISARAA